MPLQCNPLCCLFVTPKFCINIVFNFSWELIWAPRETENNAYANFWVDKQRALWYVMVFSGVVNCYGESLNQSAGEKSLSKNVNVNVAIERTNIHVLFTQLFFAVGSDISIKISKNLLRLLILSRQPKAVVIKQSLLQVPQVQQVPRFRGLQFDRLVLLLSLLSNLK